MIDFDDWPARADTGMAGLLLVIPDLIALDLPALVAAAGYPDTRVIPAFSWMLSLLALKLTATRRVSHVDDLLIVDPAAALLAGLAVLPKKSALTGYSYRLSHDHQRAFLAALDAKMIGAGLAADEEAIFDLDFHAVMHWGRDPVLEKHYVPTRSQRARSVLTFFAHPAPTTSSTATPTSPRPPRPVRSSPSAITGSRSAAPTQDAGHGPEGHHSARPRRARRARVKFLTLRMRSPALVKYISRLTSKDFTTISLDRPGPYNRPRVHETRRQADQLPRNRPPAGRHRPWPRERQP